MTALLRAEARKLVTTRSAVAMAAAVVAYPALGALGAALAGEGGATPGDLLQVIRGGADLVTVAALVLGILAVAGEYRYGTIVPTLLVVPRRDRLVAAKLAGQALFGAALGLAAGAVAVAAGGIYLTSEGVDAGVLSGDVLVTVAGAVLVAALYAAIGAAVGAVVRNQTAAVAGALVWVLTVENVVPVVLRSPGLKRWLPGGAADRLLHLAGGGPEGVSAWAALAMLAGLAAALTVAAVAAVRRADVQ